MNANKRDILVVVDNDYSPDIRVQNEIDLLSQAGFRVKLLCFGFKGKEYVDSYSYTVQRVHIARKTKNKLFFVSSWTKFYTHFWAKQIQNELKAGNFALLYVHDLYMVEAGRKAIQDAQSSAKLVVDLHENFPAVVQMYSWTKGLLRSTLAQAHRWSKKEGKILAKADYIITLHESYSAELSQNFHLPPERFHAFANMVHVPDFDGEIEWPFTAQDEVVFLYYGAVGVRRGILDFLEVFNRMHDSAPNARVLIIGPVDKSDASRFQQLVSDSSSAHKIVYIPWIEHKSVTAYLKKSDVCLAPFHVNAQHNSGVANKIYLYIQAGKYVLASACKPQMAVIEAVRAGHIFHNEKELDEAIRWCAQHPDELKSIGTQGQHNFERSGIKERNRSEYLAKIIHWSE